MPAVSAVVLHSAWSQLGDAERALLEGAAQPLLERVWSALTALSDDPLIVASPAESGHLPVLHPALTGLGDGAPAPSPKRGRDAVAGVRIVPDNYPHLWPLGALYAGLVVAKHDRSLVVSSDMPLLNLPLLRYMILLSPDYDVVIARLAGNLQPLHAVYGRACVPVLELALAGSDPRIATILLGLRVRYVDDTEVDTFDPNHRSFFRVQSARDWESLEMKPGHPAPQVARRSSSLAQRIAGPRKR